MYSSSRDCTRLLDVFSKAGYRTELTFPHWLGKAYRGVHFIDIIFSSGNGVCRVDEGWFKHSTASTAFGVPMRLCPVEETIWSKSFVMERERFDGADVAHLLRSRGRHLDWTRLVGRFGDLWPVLLSHLILFRFIYPDERGTLLSRAQYLADTEEWGYRDARLLPEGALTADEIARWTAPVFHGPMPASR
jgi:hypothetical protein